MAKLYFRDILVQIGFSPENAIRQELILDSLIAEKLKAMAKEELQNNRKLSDDFINKEIRTDYSDYFEHVTQELHLSQRLLAREKLDKYLESI